MYLRDIHKFVIYQASQPKLSHGCLAHRDVILLVGLSIFQLLFFILFLVSRYVLVAGAVEGDRFFSGTERWRMHL